MDVKDIQIMVTKELASKIINTLPDEQKNVIISEAVKDVLVGSIIPSQYEIRNVLKDYALAYAAEYAQTEEIQTKLREQAHEVVDDVLEGIVELIGVAIENDIKGQYVRILSEKKYGER